MVIVYVLRSVLSKIHYVGITEDLERRLKEHNAGKSKFTSGHVPWVIIYSETQPDFATARKREKYLKSSAGKRWLEKYFTVGGSLPD